MIDRRNLISIFGMSVIVVAVDMLTCNLLNPCTIVRTGHIKLPSSIVYNLQRTCYSSNQVYAIQVQNQISIFPEMVWSKFKLDLLKRVQSDKNLKEIALYFIEGFTPCTFDGDMIKSLDSSLFYLTANTKIIVIGADS